MNRQTAFALVQEMLTSKNLIKHCLAVEAIMRALARKLREMHPELPTEEFDENEWAVVGLLHDADYELVAKDEARHTLVTEEKIRPLGASPRLINAIKAHHDSIKPQRENYLERAVYAADELSGLITAVALVMPDKKLDAVTAESVLKKFHQKSFAAGAKREQILACEQELGIPLNDFIALALSAMQGIADELGL